jgi:hypothetical protein
MPLDTSIALNTNAPQPINPLQQALQVAQFRAYNANGQAAQQGLDANRAISAAYQQATDPTTGQVDNNKLMAIISQNPAAGFKLGEVVQGINTQKQQQQTLARGDVALGNEQLDSAAKHIGWAYQTAGAIANNPNATASDVTAAIGRAIDSGQITPKIAAQALADMPGTDAPKGALQQWAANHVAQASGAAQQLGIMLPKTGAVSTGGGTTLYNQSPVSGQVTPTTVFQNTVGPETAAQMVDVINPDGSHSKVPTASVMKQTGVGGLLPPQAQPQGGSGDGGNGRYPGGSFQTAPAAGTVEAQQKVNAAGGDMLSADQQSNAQSGTRVNMLQNAGDALSKAQTGTGADKLNAVRGLVATLGGPADKVASYDEANKYLTQYAQQKAASFGHGTDSQLAAAIAGNGNTHISNLAAQDVVKVNLGLERMEQARMKAWESAGLQPSQYGQWKSQFGSTMDPRVFVADQMEPTKVQAMVKSMNPKQQATFRTQYNWAVQNGYINGPQ